MAFSSLKLKNQKQNSSYTFSIQGKEIFFLLIQFGTLCAFWMSEWLSWCSISLKDVWVAMTTFINFGRSQKPPISMICIVVRCGPIFQRLWQSSFLWKRRFGKKSWFVYNVAASRRRRKAEGIIIIVNYTLIKRIPSHTKIGCLLSFSSSAAISERKVVYILT